jgi:lysozyme family protein
VKVDGIMGTKSMAALEAMKQHRLVLISCKDVDGIRGIKTTAAINAVIKKCLLRLWH